MHRCSALGGILSGNLGTSFPGYHQNSQEILAGTSGRDKETLMFVEFGWVAFMSKFRFHPSTNLICVHKLLLLPINLNLKCNQGKTVKLDIKVKTWPTI